MNTLGLSRLGALSALMALASCATPEIRQDLGELGSGPAFLRATSGSVHGVACSFTPGEWTGVARGIVENRWGAIGQFSSDGVTYTSASQVLDAMETTNERDRELLALQLNIVSNDAGIFGMYANLGDAQIAMGSLYGTTARQLTQSRKSTAVIEAARAFNQGFAGCDPMNFTTSQDDDGDGISTDADCDDNDATIGASLYDSDLNRDVGYFEDTPQMPSDWAYEDGHVYTTEGGQSAFLGDEELWTDYVVMSTVTAYGTKVGCGFDCTEVCGEYEPDGAYTTWEAIGFGLIDASTDEDGALTVCNNSDHDILLDPYATFDGINSQSLSLGEDDGYLIGPNSCIDTFYGSFTTDNGVYSPNVGDAPYWCFQAGTQIQPSLSYALLNARLPEDLAQLIGDMPTLDLDSDGETDDTDWAGSLGVQGQINLWDYQANHAALLVGKTAEAADDGILRVTLDVQNRGALSAHDALLSDTVPASWQLIDCDVAPESEAAAEGGTTYTWNFSLAGCTDDCSVVDSQQVTCDLVNTFGVDVDHASLPEAAVAYNDGDDNEVSYSFPALISNYDYDSDGEIRCGETDRWRAGVLGRASLDSDQDEGYHGYRCAISRNQDEGCYNPGHFLQIGEFEDVEEDGISSECEENCPGNNSFDQHGRTDHDAFDISDGDIVDLRFWMVGQDMFCSAEANGEVVTVSGSDPSFGDGGTGFSTLNMYGAYDNIKVCEAFDLPASDDAR